MVPRMVEGCIALPASRGNSTGLPRICQRCHAVGLSAWFGELGTGPAVDGVHVGDVFKISPYSVAKTFAGAGSFNTGETVSNHNAYSVTNTNDTDGIDQPITLNV